MLILQSCLLLSLLFILNAKELANLRRIHTPEDIPIPEVTRIFQNHQIIPRLIDDGPLDYLKVEYDNDVVAERGIELRQNSVQKPPKITWNAESNALYTLIMVDMNGECFANYDGCPRTHWWVANIPGNEVNRGNVWSDYVGPARSKDAELHSFVFFVFKQNEGAITPDVSEWCSPGARRSAFSARRLMKIYKLQPVAGNLFQA